MIKNIVKNKKLIIVFLVISIAILPIIVIKNLTLETILEKSLNNTDIKVETINSTKTANITDC